MPGEGNLYALHLEASRVARPTLRLALVRSATVGCCKRTGYSYPVKMSHRLVTVRVLVLVVRATRPYE
eukprot:scaffold495015_cov37-Prasinocladus_malaysianus.AAC.1